MTHPLPAPTTDIPLTQIPGELRRLTDDNERLRAALRRSTDNFCDAMRERDEARATIERARISALPVDRKAEEIRVLRALVRDIWEEIEASRTPNIETIADLLREYVAEHGAECDACEGTGEVSDEQMMGDPGAAYGYSTVRVHGACGCCRGGRRPR